MSSNLIEVIIAEDERHNREFLKTIIQNHPDFKIVGEAQNGRELVELFTQTRAQVILVDIEMPEMDGMSAVKEILRINDDLTIVFITGHSRFAVEAFEISSFDYILKPFDSLRVEKTLFKIKERFNNSEQELKRLSKIFRPPQKLYIKSGHELHFIDVESILFIEKERKKTLIHTSGNKYQTNESLNEIEKRLSNTDFFRSHKCYIINLKMVEKIIPWASDSHLVKFMNSNNDALISRSKVKMLYEILDVNKD